MSYFVWREGKPPDWVLEVASHSTVSAVLDEKGRKYAAMGVQEYWLFAGAASSGVTANRSCRGSSWWTATTSRWNRGCGTVSA